MPDPISTLGQLRRPPLLVRAAHLGLDLYDRDRALRRLFPDSDVPTAANAFDRLSAHEEALENQRLNGEASYSVARHVETLAALIFEARLGERQNA